MNREQIVSSLSPEENRVQYDGNDTARINSVAALVTNSAVLMIQALGKYTKTTEMPVDENSADLMKEARHDVALCWGALQLATSKVASVLRFDSDEVFNRMVDAGVKQEEPDLSGL